MSVKTQKYAFDLRATESSTMKGNHAATIAEKKEEEEINAPKSLL